MSYTAEQYANQLRALLPPGPIWDSLCEPGKRFGDLLLALSDELARIDLRVEQLLDESDPQTMYELLPDMELFAGLPDDCIGVLALLEQRRDALQARLTGQADLSRQGYIDAAAALGYTITITEFGPRVHGDLYNQRYGAEAQPYTWQINADGGDLYGRRYGDLYGEPYRDWGDNLLGCIMSQRAPAHTTLILDYA